MDRPMVTRASRDLQAAPNSIRRSDAIVAMIGFFLGPTQFAARSRNESEFPAASSGCGSRDETRDASI